MSRSTLRVFNHGNNDTSKKNIYFNIKTRLRLAVAVAAEVVVVVVVVVEEAVVVVVAVVVDVVAAVVDDVDGDCDVVEMDDVALSLEYQRVVDAGWLRMDTTRKRGCR